MTGCVQEVLNTDINDASVRMLTRLGCEVIVPRAQACCGALPHHLGRARQAHAMAERNVRAWWHEREHGGGLDAVVINTSGCGTTVKDYGHILRASPLASQAAQIADLAMDVCEILAMLDLPPCPPRPLKVAYHSACSLQHGQKVRRAPVDLLRRAGFSVVEPRESHLCCGSAGTYNLLQPVISEQLKARKVGALEHTQPDVIASGNLGCMVQIGSGTRVPVVHTVELMDWATGGPMPPALRAAH